MTSNGTDVQNSLTLEERLALRHGAENLEREFDGICDRVTIDEYVHASYRSLVAAAKIDRFIPLLTERFARQRLQALAKLNGRHADGTPTVLFLDEHNAGRSQMGMAFVNADSAGVLSAWSGGFEPVDRLDDTVIAAMQEVGISLNGEYPKPWTPEVLRAADLVICTGTDVPADLPQDVTVQRWDVPDPLGQSLSLVRAIRDDIRGRVDGLRAAYA